MRKYFGTDGIRRIANSELTPELVYRVAKAGAYVLSKHTDHTPTIFIGRDTRISGTLIEAAMTAGFLSYGANVKLLGVLPTPGVAYLTRRYKADASVVISASHNTFEFNGIKYFSNKGMKIPDTLEEEIEEVMDSGKLDALTAVSDKIGVSENREDLLEEYVYFFRKNFEEELENLDKANFTVAIDTANGATSVVADKVFTKLGINHYIINNHPNGININDNCGSTHIEVLQKYVKENQQQHSVTLTYSDSFKDKHNLEAMVGGEYFNWHQYTLNAKTQNSPSDDIPTLNAGSNRTYSYSYKQGYRILSGFARVNYNYNLKYLLSVVARYDGISKLSDHRWGFFPGVSAGWNIMEEDFFKDSKLADIISNLKPAMV